MEILIQTIRIYSQDIQIEISKEKQAMLIMKSGEGEMMEEIELSNQEKNQNPWRKGKLLVLGKPNKRRWKKKLDKSNSVEHKNFLKPRPAADII